MSNAPSELSKLRHDLRTPINHILGYSELLSEDLADQGVEDLKDLDKIQTAARQLLGLIDHSLSDEAFRFTATGETAPVAEKVERPKFAIPTAEGETIEHLPTVTGRILVVDDNDENREMLTKRLERQGHQTAPAVDGQNALEMLAAEKFDLVLLDVMMPVVDGYTALCQMKADEKLRHVPVIMISALDEIESVVRCIEAGAEDYLPKPFNPTLLRARIGASLSKKAFRDQEQAYLKQIEETQKRLEDELQEAGKYVISILPEPISEPFHIKWAYDPSTELGGDSFGYHWIDDNHFAIYLLDVCGHGVGAALLSVAAINVIRTGSLPEVDFHDPGQVLSGLNETFQMEKHNNMYFTIWYGVFDTATHVLRHASGGHPAAILVKPTDQGDTLEELRAPGMLIGAMPGMAYRSAETIVPKGARLFVFCDGAYEIKRADTGEMLDYEGDFLPYLRQHGRNPELPQDLLTWIRTLHAQPNLDDDYSFVAIDFPK